MTQVILVKIFGIDEVKTKICQTKEEALKIAKEEISVFAPENFNFKKAMFEKNGKIYIPVINDSDPLNFIEYVIDIK